MTITSDAPIKRAVVQALRAYPGLMPAIAGGIHEGIAPRKVRYPFIVYQIISAPYVYSSDNVMIQAVVDVSVYAVNPVEANNLDALVGGALNEAVLVVDGQTSMICRRVADLPTGPDIDSEGKRIYQVGGSYSAWTEQDLN